MKLNEGYEIERFIKGKRKVLAWYNPDDYADVTLPTIDELLQELIKLIDKLYKEG